MNFLINTSLSDLSTIIQCEKILVYAVAEMNKHYAIQNNFYNTCLNCLGIEYVDDQIQDTHLEIDHISAILEKGWAKCDSLVAWFMAVKELQGFVAEPIINHQQGLNFHVKMKYKLKGSHDENWRQIDPSQIIKKDCNTCQNHFLKEE